MREAAVTATSGHQDGHIFTAATANLLSVMGDLLGRTAFKIGLVVVVVCLLAGFGFSRLWHGNPDPGGRIMAALSTIQAAVPAQAHMVRIQHVKPRWDSCDARPGTFGWDDVIVGLTFTTRESPRSLMAKANARLRAAGWSRYQGFASGPRFGWWWSRSVPGGTALALLDRDGARAGVPQWELYAHAPPFVGPRSSGC